ncbi:MAG TPA: peptidoglycan-binding protein [Xanthobacteraceae bacterium]|nr:peptidoglycan-binding protein [Xanthobacteraceae bacterium]
MPNGNTPATGEAIVALAARHIGQTYELGELVPKNDPNWGGPWDCAEFCSWLVFQAAAELYGCAPNSKDPATADAFTGYWRDDAKAKGKIITVNEAQRIPGAFILRVPTTIGHIVVSDGKGGTVEAMGKAFGVRRGSVSGRVWDFGILVPSITYDTTSIQPGHAEDPPPSATVVILRRDDGMPPDPRVEALQRALAAAGFDPGPFDGQFGKLTEAAVFEFQAAKNLSVDGEVGPQTGRALKLKYWKPDETVPDFAKPAQSQPLPPPLADWPDETRSVNPSLDFDVIRNEYASLWNTMAIRPDRQAEVAATAATIAKGAERYRSVAASFANMLPWYVIGILHAMECGCDFKTHLHNGDPLTARTVHVPKNRPPLWDPTMSWEDSAKDAIMVDGLDKVTGWTLPRILFTFERYNGFGPRRRFGKATAYLWSYSNHYVRGKYVGDGQWDPEAVSRQAGAAVLLKQLINGGAVNTPAEA